MKKISLLCLVFCCGLQFTYAQPGELDPSFGGNGIVRSSIQSGRYTQMAIQEDGKILLAGDNGLIRYNQNGGLDQSFKRITTTENGIGAIAIQQNGKILVAHQSATQAILLSRYNIDGSVDATKFDKNPLIAIGFFNGIDLIIQNDNKIILSSGYGIFRYNSDGTIDIGFQKLNLFISSIAIQDDGKVIAAGLPDESNSFFSNFAVGRYNTDGTIDTSFSKNGIVAVEPQHPQIASSIAIQLDGKIVVGGYDYYYKESIGETQEFLLKRFNSNGTIDSTFSDDGKEITHFGSNKEICYSVTIEGDGKILAAGRALSNSVFQFALARYNTDGTLDKAFSGDGKQLTAIGEKGYMINKIAVYNNKLYAVGRDADGSAFSILARYLLEDSKVATVKISNPSDFATFTGPANIKINVEAKPLANRTISKVGFYNGNTLLHVEFVAPYGFVWRNVPLGTFTITAKATDNIGKVTTSRPVKVYVVNKPPIISIIKPSQKLTVAAPGYIHFEADAKDIDGRITRVEFYSGSTLLRSEYKAPYTFVWKNVPRGGYTVTAVATDNWGAQTKSSPVTVKVVFPPAPIVSSKPIPGESTLDVKDPASLKLYPNPAHNTVNIVIGGSQLYTQAQLSVSSVAGITFKTMQINASAKTIQLDVSSLVKGVYTIKVVSGEKVMYKKFVKL